MDYDVIVIGGGVNGTGVARDCAMRGLAVLLLEKQDFGVGASGNSSGMIHGGIRYMMSDRKVTALACRDSGYIQRIAPHLVFRIPFLMPFVSKRDGATLFEKAAWYATEVYVGTYDADLVKGVYKKLVIDVTDRAAVQRRVRDLTPSHPFLKRRKP